MFEAMEMDSVSTDTLEQQIVEDERMIARLRARQMSILEEMDTRQIALADGCRSLGEWVAGRLDVGLDTAKTMVRTMRRLQDRPDLHEALEEGRATFDRVEAVSRISGDAGLVEWADVAGVRREAAKGARLTADTEYKTADDRFLVLQPNLDESWWKLWGGLDGHAGTLVDKVLSDAADRLPELPDGTRGSRGWQLATALVETLVSDDPPPGQVSVIVEAAHATPTNGEAGVILEPGVRAGRQALAAILCDSQTEIIARTSDGRFMDYGRRQRTAPPALKRALMAKYGHMCGADGCDSRNRLQVHHVIPWSHGGGTDQDNLIVLCWFHHQVVVHERGFEPYFHNGRTRIRFRNPPPRPGPG
jgi:5-methylcytosine-specific restriction endonuclease McrA